MLATSFIITAIHIRLNLRRIFNKHEIITSLNIKKT